MIDPRLRTFLTLCRVGSYTRTAQKLHVTQPTVTQHIQYLEAYYGQKLFEYKGRQLTLTERGEMLRSFAMTLKANSDRMRTMLSQSGQDEHPLIFGATLTIGEYVMPPILAEMIQAFPSLHLTMQVDNTKVLLEKLRDGAIDFAMVEGRFDKSQVCSKLFSLESFVPVCAPQSELLLAEYIGFEDLLQQRLILREQGSGTREILEHLLAEHNYTLQSFDRMIEIGNMSAIKNMVAQNLGITFLYQEAVKKELAEGTLVIIPMDEIEITQEFNFIYLKDSLLEQECLRWFQIIKQINEGLRDG